MKIWDTVKKWGERLMQKTASATGIAREYKDIFELGDMPAFRRFYEAAIFPAKQIYRGMYHPWHVVPAPTTADPKARRELFRLNTAKAVCAELASLVWSEECELQVSMNNWTEQRDADGVVTNPDPLNDFVQAVLRDNAFREKMQEFIEQGLAMGGGAMKVWRDARRDSAGNEVNGTDNIQIGYCMADQFVPTSWDNAQVTEGVFISRKAKGGYYYTRLEYHTWDGMTYAIRNELYRSEMQKGQQAGQGQDILGIRVPLEELYPWLDEETIVRVGESLFCYWRTPVANNIDDNSPLGVSIYANALETLHAIDICYDSLVQEFRLGKKKIIVPTRMLRTVVDPTSGAPRRYYDPNDEVFVGMADNDAGTSDVHEITSELRVEEHVAALNALLSILCLQLGFSANTFSFDERGGVKTATEVISENSKTYKTVRTVQAQLIPALEHLARNIIDVAILYGMQWQGQSVESLAAGGYEVKVGFDDGIIQDRQTSVNEGVLLCGAGLLSKFTFLTDRKYGINMTEKEAREEIERIRSESSRASDEDPLRLFGRGA